MSSNKSLTEKKDFFPPALHWRRGGQQGDQEGHKNCQAEV